MAGQGFGTGSANPPNPHGANQYQLDPRQKLCWESYANPRSDTFGNAYQSALIAGYEEETAKQITVTTWFLEKTRRLNLLSKAEKVLEEMLDIPVEVIEYDKSSRWSKDDDADYEPETYLKTEPALVKIKQDTAKFIAERQGKNDGYSTRNEITGPNGDSLIPERLDEESAKAAIAAYIHGSRGDTGQ